MNTIHSRTPILTALKEASASYVCPGRPPHCLRIATMLCATLLMFLVCGAHALASDAAEDFADGSNSIDATVYFSWDDGDNGGNGFGPWSLITADSNPATAGFFIGDSSANGTSPPSGDINTTGVSFGLYSNSGDAAAASRSFTGGALGIGQNFILDMDNGSVGPGGFVGFDLITSGGSSVLSFGYAAGDANYTVVDAGGLQDTGVPFTDNGLTVAVSRTGIASYELATLPYAAPELGTSIIGAFNGDSSDISGFVLYNIDAGASPGADVYFNWIEVSGTAVPEPATSALFAIAAISIGLLNMRRRRHA